MCNGSTIGKKMCFSPLVESLKRRKIFFWWVREKLGNRWWRGEENSEKQNWHNYRPASRNKRNIRCVRRIKCKKKNSSRCSRESKKHTNLCWLLFSRKSSSVTIERVAYRTSQKKKILKCRAICHTLEKWWISQQLQPVWEPFVIDRSRKSKLCDFFSILHSLTLKMFEKKFVWKNIKLRRSTALELNSNTYSELEYAARDAKMLLTEKKKLQECVKSLCVARL